jgi:hypothetical protein
VAEGQPAFVAVLGDLQRWSCTRGKMSVPLALYRRLRPFLGRGRASYAALGYRRGAGPETKGAPEERPKPVYGLGLRMATVHCLRCS